MQKQRQDWPGQQCRRAFLYGVGHQAFSLAIEDVHNAEGIAAIITQQRYTRKRSPIKDSERVFKLVWREVEVVPTLREDSEPSRCFLRE